MYVVGIGHSSLSEHITRPPFGCLPERPSPLSPPCPRTESSRHYRRLKQTDARTLVGSQPLRAAVERAAYLADGRRLRHCSPPLGATYFLSSIDCTSCSYITA